MRLFLAGLLLAGLIGCSSEPAKKEAPKETPKPPAGAIDKAAGDAKAATDKAAADAKAAADKAAEEAKKAGATTK